MTGVFKRRLIIAAIVLFALGLVAKLPARVALSWLPDSIGTRGISGTLWNGRVQALDVQGVRVGPVSWKLKPLPLLTGAATASLECGLPGGFLDGELTLRPSSVRVTNAKLSVSLADVTRNLSTGPTSGELSGRIDELLMNDQWPTRIAATMNLRELTYPAIGQDSLGSYRLVFDPELADERWPVIGELASVDGPYTVDGTLSLGGERTYSIQADVSAAKSANQNLKNALRMLGPAKADGSHSLMLDGAL